VKLLLLEHPRRLPPRLLPAVPQRGAATAQLVPCRDTKTHLSPLPTPPLSQAWKAFYRPRGAEKYRWGKRTRPHVDGALASGSFPLESRLNPQHGLLKPA